MKKKIIIFFIIGIIAFSYGMNKKKKELNTCKEACDFETGIPGMRVTIISGCTSKEKENTNANSYFIRSRNDKIIVVDGGRDLDSEELYEYIDKYGNGKVDYWFITHPHEDHVGAMINLLNDERELIVENVYYSFNSLEWYEQYDARGFEAEKKMIETLDNPKLKNKVECKKGQVISFDNIYCEILRIANPEVTESDNGNDSSMVFKFTATDVNKSMIFLGDAFTFTSKELLENPEKLKSDAVQMAHHGSNGVTKEVYDAIDPKVCFFNTPEYLYNNNPGTGFNTGKFQSGTVRNWMKEKNTENILSFNGDQTIWFNLNGLDKIQN